MQASPAPLLNDYTIAGYYAPELRGSAAAAWEASISSQDPPASFPPLSSRPKGNASDSEARMVASQEDPFAPSQNDTLFARVRQIERKQEEEDPDYSNLSINERPKKRSGSESTPKSGKKARNQNNKESLQQYLLTLTSEMKTRGAAAGNSTLTLTRAHSRSSAAVDVKELDADAASPTPRGRGGSGRPHGGSGGGSGGSGNSNSNSNSNGNENNHGTQEHAASLVAALAESQGSRAADAVSRTMPVRRQPRSISPPVKRHPSRQRYYVGFGDDDVVVDGKNDDGHEHGDGGDSDADSNIMAYNEVDEKDQSNQDRPPKSETETSMSLGPDQAYMEKLIAMQLSRGDVAAFMRLTPRIQDYLQAREDLKFAQEKLKRQTAQLETELLAEAEGGYGTTIA